MTSEYDAFAHDFSAVRQHAWPEFELLLPLLKKGDRVLDLGCGNGRLRAFFNEKQSGMIPDGNYFGLDISTELLRIAEGEYPHDHFFRGDFSNPLPFGGDNFNAVVAIASFHHLLSKKAQMQFLEESLRVLRKNGILFLTTWKLPEKFFWSNILRGRWKNWVIPFGKERYPRTYRRTTKKELLSLLRKAGFYKLKIYETKRGNFVVIGSKN